MYECEACLLATISPRMAEAKEIYRDTANDNSSTAKSSSSPARRICLINQVLIVIYFDHGESTPDERLNKLDQAQRISFQARMVTADLIVLDQPNQLHRLIARNEGVTSASIE